MAELAQRKVVDFQIESRTSLKSIVQEFRLQPTGIAKSTSFVNWICLIYRVLVVSLDVHPPTGPGHGRYPNIRTLGAADSARLQVYIEVLKNIMHTVNAMKMVECRCLVILALTCLPILRNSRFVSTLSSWR